MTKIRQLRRRANLSQNELAIILKTSQSAVAKWETGESKPRTDKLPEIARVLHCTIDDLFEHKEKAG